MRQLNASVLVVQGYIDEALREGQAKVASSVLKALGEYLLVDVLGRRAHEFCKVDPFSIVAAFRDDARFDERYRCNQMAGLMESLKNKRR